MDIATITGIIVFLGLAIAAIVHQQGFAALQLFISMEGFLVVIGGTFCALLVNYPLGQVFGTRKVLRKVLFTTTDEDTTEIVSTFVDFTKKARTEGILSLETDVKAVKNDFMRRGTQLVIDGYDSEFIRNMLETEIGFIRERHKVGQEIFNSLGTYAPAFGIIGTVLGMILLLSSVDDPSKVPARMALALSAAFYGLSAGYLLFYPMAGKLRRRSEEELLIKEIIIRGVLLLQSGVSPIIMESNLKAYLEPTQRLAIKSTAA
ncbi:MAG: MotA/TolQ/ExbB proton channel family protein [Elusimicrobia bacterium]|nr:MotA/TolQ/ExbB proton channel family protein [Elusimicrobiota bacterium]